MSYYLFLDDERTVSKVTWVKLPERASWVVVRSYKEFVDTILTKGIPEFVTYDHDLGIEAMKHAIDTKFSSFDYSKIKGEKTGLDCAKYLVEKCINLGIKHPEFAVHSMNPVGKINIESYINSYNNSLK